MSRYIDAEPLMSALMSVKKKKGTEISIDEVLDVMEKYPTADVQKVMQIGNELFIDFPNYAEIKEITLSHKGVGCSFVEENTDREMHFGRWEVDDIGYKVVATCSVCHNEIEMPTCMGKPIYSYCPACGAQMEG